ncbi:Crp/Fnr family transcriptional regulator [Cupriavidus basilensis]|uniref:Crp/Fnr family transcriptional regulator n=1 Tax=Cupriavidus basilensis TaxID=68895 RepID=UPI0020A665A1|nr:Crp/Fnr family transcriptional regulator [Cupriavidus basilensis]MCP3019012.1 Crp/Fnr family transcriptional regulator [Cupriavidus basilensis]
MTTPDAAFPSCSLCLFQPICRNSEASVANDRRQRSLAPASMLWRAGETVHRQGRPVLAVFPVRDGSAKSVFESPLGWRQVTAFAHPGEVLGLEDLDGQAHCTSAVAMQDTRCCVVPVETARAHLLSAEYREPMLSTLRRNAERERTLLVAIGSMKAAQRLAMLLLDLAGEQRRRGNAGAALTLAMSRNDIASYLGLTLETVSRLLARFATVGLITVRQRQLRIVDPAGLCSVYEDPERVSLRPPEPATDSPSASAPGQSRLDTARSIRTAGASVA